MSARTGTSGRRAALLGSAVRTGLALGRVRLPVRGATVFAYHDVEQEPSTFFSVTPAAFRQQLEVALRCGIEFVDLGELVRRFLAGESIDGLAAVTFDDCLVGITERAVPILTELGVPATIFVVTEGYGQLPAWWADSRRTMTLDELRDAASAGLRLESHSRSHRSLTRVDDQALRDELEGSRRNLQATFDVPASLFAYPNGHFDGRVRAAVAAAGYEAAFLFVNGRILPGLDRFALPRLTMGMWHTPTKLIFDLVRTPSSHRSLPADDLGDDQAVRRTIRPALLARERARRRSLPVAPTAR